MKIKKRNSWSLGVAVLFLTYTQYINIYIFVLYYFYLREIEKSKVVRHFRLRFKTLRQHSVKKLVPTSWKKQSFPWWLSCNLTYLVTLICFSIIFILSSGILKYLKPSSSRNSFSGSLVLRGGGIYDQGWVTNFLFTVAAIPWGAWFPASRKKLSKMVRNHWYVTIYIVQNMCISSMFYVFC